MSTLGDDAKSSSVSSAWEDDRDTSKQQRIKRSKQSLLQGEKCRATLPDWQPLLELASRWEEDPTDHYDVIPFTVEDVIPDVVHQRLLRRRDQCIFDIYGQTLRPLTSYEYASLVNEFQHRDLHLFGDIALAKIKLASFYEYSKEHGVCSHKLPSAAKAQPFPPSISWGSSPPLIETPPAEEILKELGGKRSTPYQNSFASKLHGCYNCLDDHVTFGIDSETCTHWMVLLSDIYEHFSIAHPQRQRPRKSQGVITYVSLHPRHLLGINELLCRGFWSGIDVSDAMEHAPETSTVVALYNSLVVGAALLSSPFETYLTFLVVRAGWEDAGIATKMLYHLVSLNPDRDITLHVSANSAAMLLYNRFGFKAEEFVLGFYDAYLNPSSQASKNAFRLRLRH